MNTIPASEVVLSAWDDTYMATYHLFVMHDGAVNEKKFVSIVANKAKQYQDPVPTDTVP
jgi:hypothetical protein